VVELDVDVQEEEEDDVAVGREFNALVSAVKVTSSTLAVRTLSPNKGVVSVGEDDAEVVTDAVVMPTSVVVTIDVSMSGDESAVRVV
jgi:hypothetical protein